MGLNSMPCMQTILQKGKVSLILCKRSNILNQHHKLDHSGKTSEKQRTKTVTAYYNQPAIDEAAKIKSVRLTPYVILYAGKRNDGSHILKSCQYLQKEMPIRIAKRIVDFRHLPFIVGCNATILSVHELFIRAFHILNSFEAVKTIEDEAIYSNRLRELLDDHKDVVGDLAQGFRQCQKHINDEEIVAKFLDKTIKSRLSIRMLAQHHLGLRESRPNYMGIINLSMHLKDVIERSSAFVSRMAIHKYGKAPEIKLSGHVNATFPYIELPLDYILPELLKNAVRSTIESHHENDMGKLPPIYITIASNEVDFVIRISDRGGGIPHHLMPFVTQYNFTTAVGAPSQEGVFSNMMETCNPNPVGGPMHGFGFGLPTSKAYANHMGGDLSIQTMQGIGTDVYLRLKHINSKGDSIRI